MLSLSFLLPRKKETRGMILVQVAKKKIKIHQLTHQQGPFPFSGK